MKPKSGRFGTAASAPPWKARPHETLTTPSPPRHPHCRRSPTRPDTSTDSRSEYACLTSSSGFKRLAAVASVLPAKSLETPTAAVAIPPLMAVSRCLIRSSSSLSAATCSLNPAFSSFNECRLSSSSPLTWISTTHRKGSHDNTESRGNLRRIDVLLRFAAS